MTAALLDKVVLVTGGGGGIGAASSLLFAEAGARLVVTDIDEAAGKAVAEAIAGKGGEAIFIAADLAVESDIAKLIDESVKHYGRLDGAFNNAGVPQLSTPLHEISTAQWEHALRIDLTAVFWCIKYQVLTMRETGGGAIVNTASGLGMIAIPNAAEYVSAKHGVVGITRAAAVEYGKIGIRCNCILPGIVMTPMLEQVSSDPQFRAGLDALRIRHPVGRFGQPDEIAEAAKWLLSDSSSFVNGVAMPVDGGFLAN